MSIFADRLKELRAERRLSQQQLADILETSKQVISRYETDQRTPKITVANEYASKLGVELNYLLGSDEKEKPATDKGDGLTDKEREYLRLYRAAPPDMQAAFLAALEAAEKARLARDSSAEGK